MFARFALEISKALTVLDGPLLLLLPGMAAVSEVLGYVDDERVWPQVDRDRLRVASLNMLGGPPEGEEPPAGVIIAGLTRATDADDSSFKDARAWLDLSEASILINPRVSELPIEMGSAEAAYCLITYTVAKTDTWREDGELYQTDEGSAVLWRKFPSDWRVLLDTGNSGDWSEIASLSRRPSEEKMSELLLPTMQRRQAALDALQGDKAPMTRPPGAGGPASPLSAASSSVGASAPDASSSSSSVDDESDGRLDAAGVVTITLADTEGKGYGPMALYGAVAMLRMRSLGAAATYDQSRDARGVHILLPTDPRDAAASWTPMYGKLRADLTGCCHLVPDGAADGLASLEQLAIKPGSDDDQVGALIERALAEAAAAGQQAVLVRVTDGGEGGGAAGDEVGVDGVAAQQTICLRAAGFRRADSADVPQDVQDAAVALASGGGRRRGKRRWRRRRPLPVGRRSALASRAGGGGGGGGAAAALDAMPTSASTLTATRTRTTAPPPRAARAAAASDGAGTVAIGRRRRPQMATAAAAAARCSIMRARGRAAPTPTRRRPPAQRT